MDLDRRKFLKTLAVSAAASALPGCEREAHNLVPYVLPDDEIVPGAAQWYASVCGECSAGCGILARVMEGRAKKIEGNPDHPVNQGKLCARGQAALQRLYNPDRVRQPLRRAGERGSGQFDSIGWDEAITLWVDALRGHRGRAVTISVPVRGTLGDLFSTFMTKVGGDLLCYDPGGELPLREAAQASFGIDRLPFYDLAQADYLLSFGAPFLEDWVSPVALGRAFGHFRQGRPGLRGRFIQIEPRLSLTAASADRWIPIRSGTEGFLAEGIAQVLLKEGWDRLPAADRQAYRTRYLSVSLARVAAATGIAAEEIHRLARELSQASAPLAIAGGPALWQTNSTEAAMAVNTVNVLAGNLRRPGGIQLFETARLPGSSSTATLACERDFMKLVGDFERGTRTMLQLHQSNPLFTLPPSIPVRRMFEHAEFTVSFNTFLDESSAMADLILPDHDPLESWGDHVHRDLASGPVIGLQQPVVRPRLDSRSTGDVLLEAAGRLWPDEPAFGAGRAGRMPWSSFHEMLVDRWTQFPSRGTPDDEQGSHGRWITHLQAGGWWSETGREVPLSARTIPPAVPLPVFEGDEREFPLYFCPFPSPTLGRGGGANLPWLQQLPDPLTSGVWGTWIEINPDTARRYGIRQGEIVLVRSLHGQVQAPAVVVPGIRPDTVAMPLGQGHTQYGRYARGRGAHPLMLLGAVFDERSGALAAGATRVRLEPTGKPGTLVLLERVEKHVGGELISIDRKHAETPI